MTIDEAIRKYRETLSGISDSTLAISALAALFSDVRAHRVLDEFGRAIPEPSRKKHIEAMEAIILDLAECEEGSKHGN